MKRSQNINFKGVFHILGILLMIEGLFMSSCILISLVYKESVINSFILSTVVTGLCGFLFWNSTSNRSNINFGIRESFLIVTLGWFLMSLFGTLPYLISNSIPRFVDALFEAVSGFSTTGASILTDVEKLSHGILFWRSLTHWIGGMGIIVLAIALLPYLKIEGVLLFNNEASVLGSEKLHPRIVVVAKRLWIIYSGLTIIETILLWAGDMTLFDAVCHSFGTIATGGFSTKNTSLINYSPYAQYVVIIFMTLSGINFTLHYFALRRQFKKIYHNEELRYYLMFIFGVSLIITVQLFRSFDLSLEHAFRNALFQVSSIMTATGFATDDYLLWPPLSLLLIFLLMFVGASAGSTGGGIKVIRHVFLFKKVRLSLKMHYHGSAVIPLKINNVPVDPRIVDNVLSFIMLYLATFLISSVIMIILGVDFHTSIGSVITCMGGIGPGLGQVGPMGNFSGLPDAGKSLLSFLMIAGRLELFSVFIIFTPQFWRN